MQLKINEDKKPEVSDISEDVTVERASSETKEIEESTTEVSIKRKPKKKVISEEQEEVSIQLKKPQEIKPESSGAQAGHRSFGFVQSTGCTSGRGASSMQ
jgi:hypothetical protein